MRKRTDKVAARGVGDSQYKTKTNHVWYLYLRSIGLYNIYIVRCTIDKILSVLKDLSCLVLSLVLSLGLNNVFRFDL